MAPDLATVDTSPQGHFYLLRCATKLKRHLIDYYGGPVWPPSSATMCIKSEEPPDSASGSAMPLRYAAKLKKHLTYQLRLENYNLQRKFQS